MAIAMRRSTSVTNLATGASYLGTSHLGTSHLGTSNQLGRGLSMSKEPGTSFNANVGSLSNFMRSTPSMLNLADIDGGDGIEDEDLGNLLEDLAAPIEACAPLAEMHGRRSRPQRCDPGAPPLLPLGGG